MRRVFLSLITLIAVTVAGALPASAAATDTKLKNNLIVTGNATIQGTTTHTGTVTNSGNMTVGGTLGVTGAVSLTVPLTAANIQTGSAKRQVLTARLSPETGVAADATVYRGSLYFGRAGTVTRITYGTGVDPVSGTNVIAIEKGSYSGNTMLSTATVSLNGTTANTGVTATLTATSADLALTAAQPVCCEYNAGTQGTDAEQVTVTVEFEPTDF